MCLKINWSVKHRDIGLVWELLAPGYGLLIERYISFLFVCFFISVTISLVQSDDVCEI